MCVLKIDEEDLFKTKLNHKSQFLYEIIQVAVYGDKQY